MKEMEIEKEEKEAAEEEAAAAAAAAAPKSSFNRLRGKTMTLPPKAPHLQAYENSLKQGGYKTRRKRRNNK